MELLSLLLSFAGLGVSGFAYLKAQSAEQAAASVVMRQNNQEDRDRLRELIRKLVAAKDAALRQKGGANYLNSVGRRTDEQVDLHTLNEADDALRTGLPHDIDDDLANAIHGAAEQLSKAIEIVENPASNRDGWKDALSTLQTIIPLLEQSERHLRNVGARGEAVPTA
jgi:hypothetical protein